MKQSGIPGMAVAVVHDGKIVYTKGFGVKDVRNDAKVDSDTVFQVASVSNHCVPPWSHVRWAPTRRLGYAGRVHAAVIRIADPDVTRDGHRRGRVLDRSGLPDHSGDRLEDLGYDRRDVLDRFRQLPLAPFRSRMRTPTSG